MHGKHLQHTEGKREHQHPYSSLLLDVLTLFLPVSLSLCLCLPVHPHWQDLLAPGSCYVHNILDQSSLVIGQRGFSQRKKEAPVTGKDI